MNIHIEVLRSEHKDLFHLGEDGRARWETSCAQCLFAGNCQASSSPATRIYTPTGNARQFPHFHPRLVLSSVFLRRGMRISGLFSHSDRCIVVSGYGFNLHFYCLVIWDISHRPSPLYFLFLNCLCLTFYWVVGFLPIDLL